MKQFTLVRSVLDNISLKSRTVTLRARDLLYFFYGSWWVILLCAYIFVDLLVLGMVCTNWWSTCLGNQAVVLLAGD